MIAISPQLDLERGHLLAATAQRDALARTL